MCACGIDYPGYLCLTHLRQKEHENGRHHLCDHELVPLADCRAKNEDEGS